MGRLFIGTHTWTGCTRYLASTYVMVQGSDVYSKVGLKFMLATLFLHWWTESSQPTSRLGLALRCKPRLLVFDRTVLVGSHKQMQGGGGMGQSCGVLPFFLLRIRSEYPDTALQSDTSLWLRYREQSARCTVVGCCALVEVNVGPYVGTTPYPTFGYHNACVCVCCGRREIQ